MNHWDVRKMGPRMEDSEESDDCGVTYNDFRRFYGTEGHFLVLEAASYRVDHTPGRDKVRGLQSTAHGAKPTLRF
jgi:hypothetical protein